VHYRTFVGALAWIAFAEQPAISEDQSIAALKERLSAITAEADALEKKIADSEKLNTEIAAQEARLEKLKKKAAKAAPSKSSTPPVVVIPNDPIITLKREVADGKQPKKPKMPDRKDPQSWFLGGGLAARINLSGDRADEINTTVLENGDLFAQVAKSEEAEVRLLLESHYLFEDLAWRRPTRNKDGILTGTYADFDLGHALTSIAGCGIFAFDYGSFADRRGCGPFIGVAFSEDATAQEFAIGHMISFGRDRDNDGQVDGFPFNLGYGVILDPDSQTIDTRLFERGTMIVKEEFANAVQSGGLTLTTEEETLGFVLLFSTNFR